MADDRIVLYLNWDGFASYYYDEARERGVVPVLESLRSQGVFFENAYCGIPAITNPMQTAIASGAYACKTGNVKVHYDKTLRTVVGQRRENNAENIVQAFRRQGVPCASVQHFTFENNGTADGDVQAPYIALKNSTFLQRFDAMEDLLLGRPVHSGGRLIEVSEPPRFVACYMEDLDTIGHNNGKLAPVAVSEEQRLDNVLWRLGQMDTALGNFLQTMETAGLLDRLSVFLLTDHGMTPFTRNEASADAYEDFLSTLKSEGLTYEFLKPGMSPVPGTDLVICSAGLSLLLSFLDDDQGKLTERLKRRLEGKSYIGRIMTGAEIERTGSIGFCDLYVSAKPPCILQKTAPRVGGATHDSLDDSALHIFSMMWGNGIQKGYEETRRIQNIDFASTMATLLGVEPPRDNQGTCLRDALTWKEI